MVYADDGSTVTREVLREVSSIHEEPLLSLFQPTLRATVDERQNTDRLKTLLGRAGALLAARGLTDHDVERFLEPVRGLLSDGPFWRRRLDGLAIFVSPNLFWHYRVPFPLPEWVTVGDSPCVKPLLPAAGAAGYIYVLALSRNRVRLLSGTRGDVREIDLRSVGVPANLAEALRYDDMGRQMQSHSTGRAEPRMQTHSQAAGRAGRHVWHGHGLGEEGVKEQTKRYLHAIDEGIGKLLADKSAPLVLAGVAYEQDLFRHLTTHPHVMAEGVDGNPDRISADDLVMAAWPIGRRALEMPIERAKVAYREVATVGEGTDDLSQVLRAAHQGRIAQLLLRYGPATWGFYDETSERTEVHEEPVHLDVDLLDLAARQTLLHGGDAYLIDSDEMPCGGDAAALYRY